MLFVMLVNQNRGKHQCKLNYFKQEQNILQIHHVSLNYCSHCLFIDHFISQEAASFLLYYIFVVFKLVFSIRYLYYHIWHVFFKLELVEYVGNSLNFKNCFKFSFFCRSTIIKKIVFCIIQFLACTAYDGENSIDL